jgi:hypothetical protein
MSRPPLEELENGGRVECGLAAQRPAEGLACLRLFDALDARMHPRAPTGEHGRLIDDYDWIPGDDPQK